MKVGVLPRAALEEYIHRSRVIEQDGHGIKVLALPEGQYLKYFRRKRRFNKELLSPAAVRFARHAQRLQHLGVPTLHVLNLYRIAGEPHTVAIYEPLPGDTLRALLAQRRVDLALSYRVGVFLARLHRLGILFRSVHPGNIVVGRNQHMGLIDVLDMRFRPWSLLRWQRRRNWHHFMRCEEDRQHWTPALIEELLAGYGDAADLPRSELAKTASRVQALWSVGRESQADELL